MDSLQFICDMYEKNQEYEFVSIFPSQCRNYQPSLQIEIAMMPDGDTARGNTPSRSELVWLDGCYP